MTQLVVEQADLSDGTGILYKNYGHMVRMAYDPRQVTEEQALQLLRAHHPKFAGLEPRLQIIA